MSPRCPGQDQRYWKPEDIFDVRCPYCGSEIEFWKDEPFHICRGCEREVRNPRIDLGCAKWCAHGDQCLGHGAGGGATAAPVVERLMAQLEQQLSDHPERLRSARELCALADTLLQSERAEPRLVKPAALLVGAALRRERTGDIEKLPALEEELLVPETTRALLIRSGIDQEETDIIAGLVRSVVTAPQPGNAESILLWDAVQLLLHRLAPAAGEGETPTPPLHTRTARALARRTG